MALTPGNHLGPYEILTPIGAGGMGEVYRARDTKLGREVAIKILPDALTHDSERLARFEREAKVLASLNHPNIAQIYAVEQSALVMELVQGETLQGPLALDIALRYARQIAEALEAAQERGIVHRDLKPANIMVMPAGVVKVLDFGLAAMPAGSSSSGTGIANSPTLTISATRAGMILGTAAYMSPEQARGHAVDGRADIWAFGAILFELLSGKMAFEGDSITDILASVVKLEPDWSALPASTPPMISKLVKRCLAKDRRQRLQAIGEARIAIDECLADPSRGLSIQPAALSSKTARLPWILAAALLLATLATGFLAYRHVTEDTRVLRLSVVPPDKVSADMPALSPDGRRVAFLGMQGGERQLWVRELDSALPRALPGTDAATYPFWSPDSRTIAFFQNGKLKSMEAAGGPALTICDAPNGRSGSWSPAGVIVFAPTINVGIHRVPASGGQATPVTEVDRASGENAHRMPWFLPDGHHFLYTARNNDPDKTAIYLADLNSSGRKRLLAASSNAVYSPPGFLLFLRDRTLMAQPFDASKAQLQGDPVLVAEQIQFDGLNLTGRFSVSQTGVLAYLLGMYGSAFGSAQLTWYDRTGKPAGTIGKPGVISWPAISPDGRTVAYDRVDQNASQDIWLYDRARGTESRFTFNTELNSYPVWSPDGTHIAFRAGRPGSTLIRAVGGAAQNEVLNTSGFPTDWSRDGRYIFAEVVDPKTSRDIWVLPLFGDRKPFPYLHMDFSEFHARLSPNGQWLAYTSDETKQNEIYVQTFPNPGGKWQVSANGGTRPVWSRDGKELFFTAPGGKLMAVEIGAGPKFEAGVPKPLFDTRMRSGVNTLDVGKDGHFIIPALLSEADATPITVVVNWSAALKK